MGMVEVISQSKPTEGHPMATRLDNTDKEILVLSKSEFASLNALLYGLRVSGVEGLDRIRQILLPLAAGLGVNNIEDLGNMWNSIHMPDSERVSIYGR